MQKFKLRKKMKIKVSVSGSVQLEETKIQLKNARDKERKT